MGFLINPYIVGAVDTTPPTITSSSTDSIVENAPLAHALTASEIVTWSIVGGADQAQFQLSGSTLQWSSNGWRDFDAPSDANTDNAYVVTIRATDGASNTTDQTITVTVTDGTFATWDSGTLASVTLSGGNLIATNTGTTSANQGAHAPTSAGKSSGKFVFEVALTTKNAGVNCGAGIGTTASTFTNMGNSATTGNEIYYSGNIWANGSNSGSTVGGTLSQSIVLQIAPDLDNRSIWFRVIVSGVPGNWNGSGTANPATNTGGIAIPAGTMIPFVTFGGTSGNAGNAWTANFGEGTPTVAIPAGFNWGWPS